jgi:predicted ester cyclase
MLITCAELMGIPPTGWSVDFAMLAIHRIAGSRIVEGWVNVDALGLMQQLGVIPQPGPVGA